MDELTTILRWGWLGAEALLLVLLFRRRLAERYPWWTMLVGIGLAQQLVLAGLNQHAWSYAQIWSFFELAWVGLFAGAANELTRKTIDHYSQIANRIVSVFGALFGLGVLAGTACVLPMFWYRTAVPAAMWLALKALAMVGAGVAVYLISQTAWFTSYPLAMRPNVRLHRKLLTTYGGVQAAASLALLVWSQANVQLGIQTVMMVVAIGCLVAWCVGMTPKGEVLPATEVGPSEAAEREAARILQQFQGRASLNTLIETSLKN